MPFENDVDPTGLPENAQKLSFKELTIHICIQRKVRSGMSPAAARTACIREQMEKDKENSGHLPKRKKKDMVHIQQVPAVIPPTKEELNYRERSFPTAMCGNCGYFSANGQWCAVLTDTVQADFVCNAWQATDETAQLYTVSPDDLGAFGRGMVKDQPYQHVVDGLIETPAGPIVLIHDTMKPTPHFFSLPLAFHIAHTSREHGWTQEEVDALIASGEEDSEEEELSLSQESKNLKEYPTDGDIDYPYRILNKADDDNIHQFEVTLSDIIQQWELEGEWPTSDVRALAKPGPSADDIIEVAKEGQLRLGALKNEFREFFLEDDQRLIFRKFSVKDGTDTKLIWNSWIPKDQTPYVLSKGAVDSNWLPPVGFSALPTKILSKVPEMLEWWGSNPLEERLAARKRFAQLWAIEFTVLRKYSADTYLLEGDCECEGLVQFLAKSTKPITGMIMAKDLDGMVRVDRFLQSEYTLMHHWWKSPVSLSGAPDREHWDLFMDGTQHVMDKNLMSESAKAVFREPYSKDLSSMGSHGPESIEPGQPGNPTKNMPSWVQQVDSGKVDIIDDSPLRKRVRFNGKGLNGIYTFSRKKENSNLWSVEKEKPNMKLVKRLSKSQSLVKLSIDFQFSNIRHLEDGTMIVESDGLSYGVWNGEYYGPEVITNAFNKGIFKAGIPYSVGSHARKDNDGEILEFTIDNGTIKFAASVIPKEAQKLITDKKVTGNSFELMAIVDHARNIIDEIVQVDRLVAVDFPACAVCIF